MATYEVKLQVKVPKSRNAQSGKVKYQNSGYGTTTVKVDASSPEEARKKAAKTEKVAKAKAGAARGLDYDMPKPRVQVTEITRVSASGGKTGNLLGRTTNSSTRGGGSMGGGSIKTPDEYGGMKKGVGGTRRKMNKGGYAKKKK